MLPVGPLMTEHRLIERMIKLMAGEMQRIKQGQEPNVDFVVIALDFIRTYADKLHHGKEEDILFRVLAKKKMSQEHWKMMEELIKEHAQGRGNVKKLEEALNRYKSGDKTAAAEIAQIMVTLADFYPRHIEKEDKRFFLPIMDYLSLQEKEAMLKECFEFDRQFIHSHYKGIVEKA